MGGGGSKRKASETPAASAKGSAASVKAEKPATLKKDKSKDKVKDKDAKQSEADLLKRAAELEAQRAASKKKKEEDKPEKMFAKPEGPKRSKIYQALNPEKLYYESAREKAEKEETKAKLVIRGGALGAGPTDFAVERDEEGNIIEQEPEEPEVEETFDVNNLPDFTPEEKAELEKRRKEREAAQAAKQAKLRAEYLKKKEAEDKKREAEVKKIKEEEAKRLKSQPQEDPNFVKQAQARLEAETKDLFRDFSFKK
eukprot:m.104447 g.104447  ORF g.104447 m.104447 type:complete len:255 (+) comp15758_c0_seq1:1626-2390(+)